MPRHGATYTNVASDSKFRYFKGNCIADAGLGRLAEHMLKVGIWRNYLPKTEDELVNCDEGLSCDEYRQIVNTGVTIGRGEANPSLLNRLLHPLTYERGTGFSSATAFPSVAEHFALSAKERSLDLPFTQKSCYFLPIF